MYSYIKQYPKNREMGWSEEVNGVCHDENNWFFTQNGNLWKFPLGHRIGDTLRSANNNIGYYKVSTGKHLGDIDYYNEHVFVPVSDNGSIRIYRAKDLRFVTEQVIKRQDGRSFTSLGWLAINPKSGLLYTSDTSVGQANSGSTSLIHIYKIGDLTRPNPLTLHSTARLFDEYAEVLNREHMQGGCFDDDDHLHIVNGYVTTPSESWANSKGGISVFKVLREPPVDGCENLYRLTHSNQSRGFRFQFNGNGEEPEGLTYWDLDAIKGGKDPEMEGQLHAIMIDNLGSGDDDFYFKHYRKISTGFYRVSVKTGDVKSAGTDADIFITLTGTNGTSNEVELDAPGRDDFERGNTDMFIIETILNVGTISQIVVRSDNRGSDADFFLEKITIVDIETNKTYNFSCNRWFTKKQSVSTFVVDKNTQGRVVGRPGGRPVGGRKPKNTTP